MPEDSPVVAATHAEGLHPRKIQLIALNLLGGLAVLGSYVHGFGHPEVDAFWGEVPLDLRPVYTVSMFGAALGYFPFTAWILLRLEPDRTRVGPFGYGIFLVLYALVLIPSALWMPMTFQMIEVPSQALWIAIRLDLALVALGTIGLLASLLLVEPRERGPFWAAAVAGAILFFNQTVVLDAIVWPFFYPV
jgi:hypothetical protein